MYQLQKYLPSTLIFKIFPPTYAVKFWALMVDIVITGLIVGILTLSMLGAGLLFAKLYIFLGLYDGTF